MVFKPYPDDLITQVSKNTWVNDVLNKEEEGKKTEKKEQVYITLVLNTPLHFLYLYIVIR